ncbi:MAG TPA: WhiB family transcriptional regulator [Actinomycetota bacterium]|jgi:WhiB family redox-sensing transcriptional regulator
MSARHLAVRPLLDTSWMTRARCHGYDVGLFYPEGTEPAEPGVRVCEGCPVRRPCLEYALATGEQYGIWGGTTEPERAVLLKRMRALRSSPAAMARRVDGEQDAREAGAAA